MPREPCPAPRPRGAIRLHLRSRLLLLVVASIFPLLSMALVREYTSYQANRKAVYQALMTTARATAFAVERELQLRVSALETLAMSPALQTDDLGQFDQQAESFLARQPSGTVMGLAGPDLRRLRSYGMPPDKVVPLLQRESFAAGGQVFDTRRPVVTDIHTGRVTGLHGFSIDVPVFQGDRVAYDLYIRLLPNSLADLVARQELPKGAILTVVDSAGIVASRNVNPDRFIGSHVVPELWAAVSAHDQGVTSVPTLEGVKAIAAYTHVAPFGWAVIVGAPQDVVFAPLLAAIEHVALAGAVGLAAGLLLAMYAARGIIQPIARLRRLAEHDDQIDPSVPTATGLPETDSVARALVTAAAERHEAAKALAESEARFRALFESSSSGTILLDPDSFLVLDCNAAAAAYAGLTTDEFRGRPITDFALDDSRERIRALARAVVAGQNISYETQIKSRLGPRNLTIAAAPFQSADRTVLLVNQIDVTDLRRAEAGLRLNEERLELARQGANLGIWDWDVVNDTLSWSEHQWELHGLEPRPGGPSPDLWRQVVAEADYERTVASLTDALKIPNRQYAAEYSVAMPDGSRRRLLACGQAIRDAGGRAVRMVGINMDVTARYEAEMARDRLIWMLETERSRLAEIIEALPLGVGIVDTTGRIVLGNAAMQRLNGPILHSLAPEPRGEWIAHDAVGNRLPPSDYPVRRALQRGETTLPGNDFLFRDSDGLETWYRVGSLPLRWENGAVQEALAIYLDIDAEKRLLDVQQQINAGLEQRVQREVAAREAAQQRAAHAERMHALGQIAGGIAHDFNNVLQAVAGGAALIERRPTDTERVLRHARTVLDASSRGAAITSRLLAFSRRGDLRAESIDAGALLTDMAEVLTHTLGGSVRCTVRLAPELPPMFADRGQLETVLVNLAANARDAMPTGGTLTLAAEAEVVAAGSAHRAGLGPGTYVRLTVSDDGTGMDDQVRARVTEPFFTTKEPGKGTGLGLAMAKGFAEQSGGSLDIDSKAGQGTSVFLWLPRAAAEKRTAASAISAPKSAAPIGGGRTRDIGGDEPERPSVLLVDDDTIVREVLALSLEDSGYVVLPADGGTAALVRLDAGERVDIIVSDLTMPNMDGLALIRIAQERRPGLPAVLLTGYAGDGATLAVGGAISGTFSLLRKPVSGPQLVDRINALIASRKRTNAA